MIELYDAALLEPRRDWSQPAFALALVIGAGTLAAYAYTLNGQLRQAEAQRATLLAQVERLKPAPAGGAALLADLQRQTERLESRLVSDDTAPEAAWRPSDWLQRLAALKSADVSLARVEVERGGAAFMEGLATTPDAVSRFVQAFARQDAAARLRARSIELRQDKAQTPYLRFALRASAPAPAAAPAEPPAAAPGLDTAAAPQPAEDAGQVAAQTLKP